MCFVSSFLFVCLLKHTHTHTHLFPCMQSATHQFLGYKAYVEGGAAAHGTSLLWSMAAMALASLALHLI